MLPITTRTKGVFYTQNGEIAIADLDGSKLPGAWAFERTIEVPVTDDPEGIFRTIDRNGFFILSAD